MKASFESARDAVAQDQRGDQVTARITAEARALREEARRLRVDRTRLERTNREVTRKNQIWMMSTAGSGLLAVLFLILAFTGGDSSAPTPAEDTILAVDPIYAEYGVETTPHVLETTTPPVLETTPNVVVPTPPAKASMLPTPAPTTVPVVVETTTTTNVEYTPKVELPTTYTVVGGDNVGKISQKMYGKYSLFQHIIDANPETLNGGNALQIGMELTIPKL